MDRGIEIRIGCHQHHLGKEPDAALIGQPIKAGLPWHHIIKDNEVEMLGVEETTGGFGAVGLFDLAAEGRQRAHQKIPHPRLVVDDEHGDMFESGFEIRRIGGGALHLGGITAGGH